MRRVRGGTAGWGVIVVALALLLGGAAKAAMITNADWESMGYVAGTSGCQSGFDPKTRSGVCGIAVAPARNSVIAG